ncbi:MAG: hypothetical protein JWM78_3436 [Verrucomicrobiaceae bacterium]|nr:hypothetical protein [Verrucomicrobiaceae bacterium]
MLKRKLIAALLMSCAALANAADLKPFSAIYETSYGFLSARGERKLEALPNNQWKVQSNAHVMNFDINENATFTFQNAHVKAANYNFDNPFSKNKSQALTFDWSNNSVTNAVNQAVVPLTPNAYDKLSYQLQLQLNVCASLDKYAGDNFDLVDRNRLKTYRVELIGKDTLKTEVGTLNTIHLRQFRPDKQDGKPTEIWLAADWSCLIVRIDQYDKDDLYTLKLVKATVGDKAVTGK